MPDIWESKGHQTMKFKELLEYKKENEAGRLVPELFLFF